MTVPNNIFITYTKSTLPNTNFITYTVSSGILLNLSADTKRTLSNDIAIKADTKRSIGKEIAISADTRRFLDASVNIKADTKRELRLDITILADTKRIITSDSSHILSLSADTLRKISQDLSLAADTKRRISKDINVLSDTLRKISNDITVKADTIRIVKNGTAFTISADTSRIITASIDLQADTKRFLYYSVSLKADTLRKVSVLCNIAADTDRHIPYVLVLDKGENVHSMTLTLAEKTLSDNMSAEIAGDMSINDAVKGSLLDYDYNFLVQETNGKDLLQTINCMLDVDKLLYTQFTYTLGENMASKQAKAIANGIGKSLNLNIDDFKPSNAVLEYGATYQNIISSIFGWTSRIPTRQVNVFIRGNTLYVWQRGKESDSIDITNTDHTRPNFNRKMIRTAWSSSTSNNKSATSVTIAPMPFDGTIEFGDSAVTYSNGFIVSETHGTSTATYNRNGDGYATAKHSEENNSDGSSVKIDTIYDYTATERDLFLAMETEDITNTDKNGNVTTSERITRHFSLGNGFYGAETTQDGVFVGSSLGQGKSGGKPSQFTINQSNLALGSSGYSGSGSSGNSSTVLLYDTSFPVIDTDDIFIKLTNEMLALNRKTQETISMDIYNLDTVIDFTKKIVYNGNTYYLQNNVVKQTTRAGLQTITAVRWY